MGEIRDCLNQLQLFGLRFDSIKSKEGKELFLYQYNDGLIVVDANHPSLLLVYCLDGRDQSNLMMEAFGAELCYATVCRSIKMEEAFEGDKKVKTKKMMLPVPVCVFTEKGVSLCDRLKGIIDEILVDVKQFPVSWLWNLLSLE